MGTAPTIEGFVVRSVKGELLPEEVRGLPLGREALRAVMQDVPIVVSGVSYQTDESESIIDSLQLNRGLYSLRQPSEMHKRSFIVDHPDFTQTWQDEYGNQYSAISTKGNNFSKPGLHKHPTAAEGVIPFGLQESSIIERVLKASQYLRSHGVSTEYIFGVTEPKEFPWMHEPSANEQPEMVSLEEYKRRIVMDYWAKLPAHEKTIEALSQLHEQFKDMTFFVTFRATDSPYRMSDIRRDNNESAVYDYVNEHLLAATDEPYSVDAPHARDRFDKEIFAPRAGVNFARMHHSGVAHKFPHMGNITALGGIVDLDSVFGKPLGIDAEDIDHDDIAYDVSDFVSGYLSASLGLFAPNIERIEAMNVFMQTYDAEIRRLSADSDKAKAHMGGILSRFNKWDDEDNFAFRGAKRKVYAAAAQDYFSRYLHITFDNQASFADRYCADPELHFTEEDYEQAKAKILELLPSVRDGILVDLSIEITDEYRKDRQLDIVDTLIRLKNSCMDERKPMLDALINPGLKRLISIYKSEQHGTSELDDSDQKMYRMLGEYLLTTTYERLMETAKDILAKKLFPEIREEIHAALSLGYPENVLSTKESTYVHICEGRAAGLLISEDVERDELLVQVKGMEVIERPLFIDMSGGIPYFNHISDTGYDMDQVIFDRYTEDSWDLKVDGPTDIFTTGLDDLPTYVAVVESNTHTGERRVIIMNAQLKNDSEQ